MWPVVVVLEQILSPCAASCGMGVPSCTEKPRGLKPAARSAIPGYATAGKAIPGYALAGWVTDAEGGVHDCAALYAQAWGFDFAFEPPGLTDADCTAGRDTTLHFSLDGQIADFDGGNDVALALDDNIATGGEVADGVVAFDLEVFEDQALLTVRAKDRHRPLGNVGRPRAVRAGDLLDRCAS